MASFFSWLPSILFPPSCVGCSRRGTGLCADCAVQVPPAPSLEEPRMFALYLYGYPLVAKAVRDLKYHHKRDGAEALLRYGVPRLSEWLADVLLSEQPEKMVLVPIPQHQSKTHERGFSQSLLLARALSRELDGATISQVLRKRRHTVPQVCLKNRKERLANLIETMETKKALDPSVLYIVVDDVITTGATVREATRALEKGGARRILAVALAHGYANQHYLSRYSQ